MIRNSLGGPLAVQQPKIAGAGVRLAGVDQNSPCLPSTTGEALGAEINAGGTHNRRCKRASTNRLLWSQEQRQVRTA
jgi:hypothetical protein